MLAGFPGSAERANRFSRGNEPGCFISFAQAFVPNCTSRRSKDKYCRLPTTPRSALLRVQVSIIVRLVAWPATLGGGAGLQLVIPMLCNTTPRKVALHSFTLDVHTSCPTRSLSRFCNGFSAKGSLGSAPALRLGALQISSYVPR